MNPEIVSLIICTRDRVRSLGACLESLLLLEAPCDWELIVVDNGSTDSTRVRVEEFAGRAPFRVRYVFEPKRGLSRARNSGVAAATGDPIVFTDDDCYPAHDYLAAILAAFRSHDVAYLGGRVLLHDHDDYPITVKTSESREILPPHSHVPAGFIHGANMAFRREVFASIGGFNEELGAGTRLTSGEDREFVARASACGFCGGYFPEPVVSHHHGRKESDAKALMKGYDLGRGAYYVSMMLNTSRAGFYLRPWWWSMSWRRREVHYREIRGALVYVFIALMARLRRRPLVPRITVRQGPHASQPEVAVPRVSGSNPGE